MSGTPSSRRGSGSGTVSERALGTFDRFVTEATRSAFALQPAECVVSVLDQSLACEQDVVMFTVSSYRFRVLLFVHFERGSATRDYFAALLMDLGGGDAQSLADERFVDAVMERGNLCCGALNRELARFYPHLGMSTPCILDGSALEHLAALQPSATRHYRAQLSAGVTLGLTLAVCAFGDIDFCLTDDATATAAGGELEMF